MLGECQLFTRTESFQQFIRFYPAVSVLTAICIILFIVTSLPLFPDRDLYTLLSGVNLFIAEGEYWRLVTPIFLHIGVAHLLFNCFTLILIGPGLETMLGSIRFTLLFLLSGILANVLTYYTEPLMYAHVGASGSIYGLFGCYAYMIFFRKDLLSPQNSQVILILIIIGLVMSFLQSSINITGHIGGLIIGFALSRILLTNR